MSDEARDEFLGALARWAWQDYTHGQDVVDAACDALVAGLDSPALRDLAGLYRDAPREVVQLTVDDVVEELGLDLPVGRDALSRYVLRREARTLLDGWITPRAFTERAYLIDLTSRSGDGVLFVSPLWEYEELDDVEEYLGHGTSTCAEARAALDDDVRRAARAFLAEPS